jgi:hypothetical protein
MARVPFFVEVISSAQSANIQICRKIMAALFKEKIAPLPFASSLKDVTDVLGALKARGMAPAVFVINPLYAEELLPLIDPLIGPVPVVYLRRRIFAEAAAGSNGTSRPNTTQVLQHMTPRLTTEWTYGSQTADEVAAKAAKSLVHFLNSGDFAVLEDFAQVQALEEFRARNERDSGPLRHGSLATRSGRPPSGPIQVPPQLSA